jgi:hypothetical protein
VDADGCAGFLKYAAAAAKFAVDANDDFANVNDDDADEWKALE